MHLWAVFLGSDGVWNRLCYRALKAEEGDKEVGGKCNTVNNRK